MSEKHASINKIVASAVLAGVLWNSEGLAEDLVIQTPPAEITIAPQTALEGPIVTRRTGDAEVKIDVSGKGAVLCSWSILVATAHAAQECGWEPENAALSHAIARIDAFIIANALEEITQPQLEARKAADVGRSFGSTAARADMCEHAAGRGSWGEMLWAMHSATPDQLAAMTNDLLSIPREPVMNPCM